jgi:hypothetical protein
MIARLSTYSNVDLDLADRLKAWMEVEGAGLFERVPGYVGSMTLVDRDNAQIVGIGFYDSAGQLAEADVVLAEIYAEGRERLPESIRDALTMTPESVGTYEVAHRD